MKKAKSIHGARTIMFSEPRQAEEERLMIAGARKRRARRKRIGEPRNLALTPSAVDVVIGWDASTGLYVDGYVILRDGNQIADVTSDILTYTDGSVTPETSYTYSVYAYNRFNGQSSPATASTTTLTVPP